MTPSGAHALSECLLRGGYASDPDFARQVPSTEAARLGTVCHQVLELAGSGRLPDAGDAEWTEAFESAWDAAIAGQEKQARSSPLDAHWPPANKWRNYSVRKVATRHLAKRLSRTRRVAAEGALHEQAQTAYGGQLRGRADVIRRAPSHEIEDYKTGSLHEGDSGELKAAYVQQMLLYAVLEHAETGSWPKRATLVPLEGDPAAITVAPNEAEAVAERALATLGTYNNAVAAGTPPEQLASPSPGHCRYCSYAIRCPAFWETAEESWMAEGILATTGRVTDVHVAVRGSFTLRLQADGGSARCRDLWLHQVDPERFHAARELEPGATLAATALLGAPGGTQLRPSDFTRLVAQK